MNCFIFWFLFLQILQRLCDLCLTADGKRNRKHEQRLLRNMGAHNVVLDLLEIPYEKVIIVLYQDVSQPITNI